MTTLREAAQQALEALEFVGEDMPHWAAVKRAQAIDALRAALAQEEQPTRAQQMRDAKYTRRPTLREMGEQEREDIAQNLQSRLDAALLLEERRQEIAQPRREWVSLTDEEILKAIGWERAEMYMKLAPNFPVDEAKQETLKNARAVERAVWEKNHG